MKNVPSVAKNSFGPLIIEEFPNSFVSTKFRKKKGFQLYHNIARRYQPSSSDDDTSNNDTVFSTPPEIITMNLFSDNKNDLSVLSLNNKKGEIIQGKYSANGDENGKNNYNNRFGSLSRFNIIIAFELKKILTSAVLLLLF